MTAKERDILDKAAAEAVQDGWEIHELPMVLGATARQHEIKLSAGALRQIVTKAKEGTCLWQLMT